jgi:hypothetical protein
LVAAALRTVYLRNQEKGFVFWSAVGDHFRVNMREALEICRDFGYDPQTGEKAPSGS